MTTREFLTLVNEDKSHGSISIRARFNINLESNSATSSYNFKRPLFHGLNTALGYIDWSLLLHFRDGNKSCQAFYNTTILYFRYVCTKI